MCLNGSISSTDMSKSTSKPIHLYLRTGLIVAFIFLINLLLYQPSGTGTILILLASIGLFATLFYGFSRWPKLLQPGSMVLIGVYGLCLWQIAHTATIFLQTLFTLAALAILGIFTYLQASDQTFVKRVGELFLIPLKAVTGYLQGLATAIKLPSSKSLQEQYFPNNKRLTSLTLPLVTGILVSIPILVILISLLASADPVYNHYVDQWFGFLNDGNLLGRIIISTLLLLGLIPLLFTTIEPLLPTDLQALKTFTFPLQYAVVMTLVALTFASFLIVQAPYVFIRVAKETELSQYGINTYSEYVQKGFGELIVVSLFVFGLIWLSLFSVRAETKASRYLKMIQLVALSEFVIFLLSIFRRVSMYIQYHGWSLNRWYGSILIIWLLGLTITLIGRHLAQKPWVRIDIGFTLVLLAIIGFIRPEPYITTHQPPTVNNRVDYLYLARMSADGYVGWQQAFEHAQQVLDDPKWQEQAIIDKDGRREIAYAGMVLSRLHRKYIQLLERYGSEAEFRTYAQLVTDHQIEVLRNQIATAQMELEVKGEQATPKYRELQAQLANALKLKADLPKLKAEELKEFYDWIDFSGNNSLPFDQSFIYPSFYYVEKMDRQTNYPWSWKPNSQWDQILIWNGSEVRAYQQMQQDMPMTVLLKLETKFFDLNQKIRLQPANQRDYEQDTLPNSIFLEY